MQNGEGDNMQTLAGILQELQAQNAGLREQNAAMARAVESQQKALETLLARRSSGVVDVKQVGKPNLLKGGKDEIRREFQNWAYIFESWFSSQFPEAKEILEWAAKHGKTELDLDDAILANPSWENHIKPIERQLHTSLVALCRDEALKTVKNSKERDGLDAWRRLNVVFNPKTPASYMAQLRRLTSPKQTQDLSTLGSDLEAWEKELSEYEKNTKEVVSDVCKRLALLDIVTDNLREHLELNSSRFTDFALMKGEIETILSNKESTYSGSAPMDVDALGAKGKGKKGKKGKGKGKGKGNEDKEDSVKDCKHCGKSITEAHTEYGCWYNTKNPKPEAVAKRAAKAKAKTKAKAKPAAKSKSKATSSGTNALDETEGNDDYPVAVLSQDQDTGLLDEDVFMLGSSDYEDVPDYGDVTSLDGEAIEEGEAILAQEPTRPWQSVT